MRAKAIRKLDSLVFLKKSIKFISILNDIILPFKLLHFISLILCTTNVSHNLTIYCIMYLSSNGIHASLPRQ